jgi:hypothetical protein
MRQCAKILSLIETFVILRKEKVGTINEYIFSFYKKRKFGLRAFFWRIWRILAHFEYFSYKEIKLI